MKLHKRSVPQVFLIARAGTHSKLEVPQVSLLFFSPQVPSKRRVLETKEAMVMYEKAFGQITLGLDLLRSNYNSTTDFADKRTQELIFSKEALIIIPGPWATPIKYCRLHDLKYILMIPTPFMASLFSQPIYNPSDYLSKNFGKTFVERGKMLWKTIFPPEAPFDVKPATLYPSLRLIQSIPALSENFYIYISKK